MSTHILLYSIIITYMELFNTAHHASVYAVNRDGYTAVDCDIMH